MFGWKPLGPKWITEDAWRVLELLKEQRLPCRMPSDGMFFFSPFHLPHPDLRWAIQVHRRDWARAVDVLEREGLMPKHAPGRSVHLKGR